MREIGFQIGAPYKILADMKNANNRTIIESTYSEISKKFSADEIRKTQEKIGTIGTII